MLLVAVLMIVGGAVWLRTTAVSKMKTPANAVAPVAAPAQAVAAKGGAAAAAAPASLAAPGSGEPLSEEMRLGFDIAGKLARSQCRGR